VAYSSCLSFTIQEIKVRLFATKINGSAIIKQNSAIENRGIKKAPISGPFSKILISNVIAS
jgi:hypothetical protein